AGACAAAVGVNWGSILARSPWASTTSPRSPARTNLGDTGAAAVFDDFEDVPARVTTRATSRAAATAPTATTTVHCLRRAGVGRLTASRAAATAASRVPGAGGGTGVPTADRTRARASSWRRHS